MDSGILNRTQQRELAEHKISLDPAALTIEIDSIQQQLVALAAAKTRNLQREVDAADAPPNPASIKVYRQAS